MKRLLTLALLASVLSLPLTAADTPKAASSVLSTYRVFPKSGHDGALKAAVAAHATKFHNGDWKWRVYEVLTGPDSGSYQINEGPASWSANESRGDLGADHMQDYETNIAPHVEKSTPETYLEYKADASSVAAAQWSTKAVVTHYYVKPGRGPAFFDTLKSLKTTWEKLGYNVVVWQPVGSGEPQYVIVRRFKNGWKDYDESTGSVKETYESIHGAGSFDKPQADLTANVERIVAEFIEYRPELSAK